MKIIELSKKFIEEVDFNDEWVCLLKKGTKLATPLTEVEYVLEKKLPNTANMVGPIGALILDKNLDFMQYDDMYQVGGLRVKARNDNDKYVYLRTNNFREIVHNVALLDYNCVFVRTSFIKEYTVDSEIPLELMVADMCMECMRTHKEMCTMEVSVYAESLGIPDDTDYSKFHTKWNAALDGIWPATPYAKFE